MLADEGPARDWLRTALACDDVTLERLEEFVALLREENGRQNLVSAASLDHVWLRHVVDSGQLIPVSRGTAGVWLDLGTGAGFPGLIVALLDSAREVVMVESRARRIEWLQSVVDRFALTNARVVGGRLETVAEFKAGVISARAFAPLDRLVALAARFSTPQTQWLLPKGRNGAKELHDMPKSLQLMFHVEPSLTSSDSVILVGRGCVSSTKVRK